MNLIKYPNIQYPQPTNSKLDMDTLSLMVDGYVEIVKLSNYIPNPSLQNVILVIKDDGAIDGRSKPNIKFGRTTIYGKLIACGISKDGELRDLSKKEYITMDKFLSIHSLSDRPFSTPQQLFSTNN